MLEVRELTVTFGGVKPLDGVSFELAAGVCGVVGPNGAGKTTLLNALSGFVEPSAGTASADATEILKLSPHARARWGLRRTFQQDQVVLSLSALDNVRVAADELGSGAKDALEAMSFVGLDAPHRRGEQLSMLERRLVEIAKTVVGQPRIVLFDEPGAGLSDEETEQLAALIRQIPERFDAQVILVDHDMALVSAVCGTTVVLDFGHVIALGRTAEVLEDNNVKRAYLGTEELL